MNLLDISKQIQIKIAEIDKIRSEFKQRAEEKARTASVYDMEIAKTLIGLQNGKEYEIEGEKIKDPPKSIMEKLAKGICWEEKLLMDTAEANYKSLVSNLEAVKTQLNGFQSINRHLDNA